MIGIGDPSQFTGPVRKGSLRRRFLRWLGGPPVPLPRVGAPVSPTRCPDPRASMVAMHVNHLVFCGSCREWFRTSDGTRPHDVEACYMAMHGALPEPNPFLSSKED